MHVRRAAGGLSAALTMAMVLCACGEASSASSNAPIPAADVSAAAANPVAVSPLPGTEDASPATQISFLGPAGTQVSDVRVVGSRSGVHGGRLQAYSTGTGESFLPAHPFQAGERVSVHARVAGAGEASTTFTIAHQAAVSQKEFPITPGDPHAIQRYSSAPGLTPSTVRITTPAKPGAAPGDLFLAPYQGDGSPGPMITEQNGSLVWFHPLPAGEQATNFQVQQYQGKPVLTWWQGRIIQVGFGEGEDVIYDNSYRHIASIRAGNGYQADLHEIRLTPQGTAWIDVFDPIHMNLSSVHGPAAGILTDSVVQEIDIKTGLVMWEWHTLGHIPLADSNNPVPRSYPWDYAHLNSADPGSTGDVSVSVRNTWTLYDIDIHSGGFIWRLGGTQSSFKAGAGHALLLAARRRVPARRADLGVRQRLGSTQGEAVAGAAAAPGHRRAHREPPQAVRQPHQDAARGKPGQHVQPPRRSLAAGLRPIAQLHRARRLRPRPPGRDARQQRAELQYLPLAVERATRRAARRSPFSPAPPAR